MRTDEELAELAHNEANKYAYGGEWGVRTKSRSDKAWIENFAQESRETREIIFAAAVRRAVIDDLADAADVRYPFGATLDDGQSTTESVVCWIRAHHALQERPDGPASTSDAR